MKNEVRKPENESVSVLNLYKRAKINNAGLWLPIGHQQEFLTKLRRIRKYEKEKKSKDVVVIDGHNGAAPNMVDVVTTPMIPQTTPAVIKAQTKGFTTPRTRLPRVAKTAALKSISTKQNGIKPSTKTPETSSTSATAKMTACRRTLQFGSTEDLS